MAGYNLQEKVTGVTNSMVKFKTLTDLLPSEQDKKIAEVERQSEAADLKVQIAEGEVDKATKAFNAADKKAKEAKAKADEEDELLHIAAVSVGSNANATDVDYASLDEQEQIANEQYNKYKKAATQAEERKEIAQARVNEHKAALENAKKMQEELLHAKLEALEGTEKRKSFVDSALGRVSNYFKGGSK